MRKFTLTLITLLLSASFIFAQTQVRNIGKAENKAPEEIKKNTKSMSRASTYEIDFEDLDDFTLNFDPWTLLDVDGLDTYGFEGVDFPNEYSPMAYICFNPSTTTPPMTDDPDIQPYEGEKFGACFASVPEGGVGNDDWLVSANFTAGDGASITFYARSYTSDWGLERFNVGVSTTTPDPEEFTIISEGDYLEAPTEWTEYTFDLSDYAGEDVYVGIHCVSYDAFIFMVDNIVIDPGAEPTPCENFDDLPVGSFVAEELPMWTTWSGTPGSSEDAEITDNEFHSPDNSFMVYGSTDLVQLFAEETIEEGAWVYSNYILVKPDMQGYWNLQKTITPGDEWALEVYYFADGTTEVYAGSETPYTFDYTGDTWMYNEVIVDIEADWAEYYVDGELIAEWQWSLGASGDGSLMSIGGANYWAWNDEADNDAYFDDVCFEEYAQPTTCIDFEDYNDFTLDLTPWITYDVDGLGTYGFDGVDFMHEYEPMAYLVFNPSETTPPMTDDPEIQPYSGDKFGACFASVPEGSLGNDDWIITPLTSLGTGSQFKFMAKSYTDAYGLERFNVGVSTTSPDPEDFTIISGDPYEEAPMAWTEFTYDLSDYDYEDVYIGIQCVSFDAFIFMLDDICIYTTPTDIEDQQVEGFNMYPNPSFDVVNINSGSQIKQVTVFNNIGQIVYTSTPSAESTQISTSELNSGIYFVRVETTNATETRKLMVR